MKEALPDLFAYFNFKAGLFRRERIRASVFELDSYGCVLKTDKLFNPGDTIVIDLEMEMPFDNIRAEGLSALVTERRKHCSNFFYTVDFSSGLTKQTSGITDNLKRIREVLGKKQSLRSRRIGPASGTRQMA